MPKRLSPILLCACLSLGGRAWPQMSAPPMPDSVTSLHHELVEAVEEEARAPILERLARTPPGTQSEVQWLYDLFMRYPTARVREAVMSSLKGLSPSRQDLEPTFLYYLGQEEPEARLFGINGAFYIRASKALPVIRKIAKKKFPGHDVSDLPLLSDRNEWWVRYEALSVLAQWDGEKAYELLHRQARRTPAAAKLMAQFLWKKSLTQILAWASSRDDESRDRALSALSAPVARQALRETREALATFMDRKDADLELRLLAAAKLGSVASDGEIAGYVREHGATTDEERRQVLAAAISASSAPEAAAFSKPNIPGP